MVRSAATSARERCVQEGFDTHWQMFERHFIRGASYAELATEFSVTGGQSASMVRTASIRFRQAVVDLLLKDVATEEAEVLLRSLVDCSNSAWAIHEHREDSERDRNSEKPQAERW